jgi:hypothetical protein
MSNTTNTGAVKCDVCNGTGEETTGGGDLALCRSCGGNGERAKHFRFGAHGNARACGQEVSGDVVFGTFVAAETGAALAFQDENGDWWETLTGEWLPDAYLTPLDAAPSGYNTAD